MLDNRILMQYRRRWVAFLERLQPLRETKRCACCEKKKPNMIWANSGGYEFYLCDKCVQRCADEGMSAEPWATVEDIFLARKQLNKEREQSRTANRKWRENNSDDQCN